MDSSSAEKVKKAALIAVATVLLVLSAAAYDYARFLGNKEIETPSSWNPLLSDRAAKLYRLQAIIEQASAASEFMVWPAERKKIRQQMLVALQKKQNLTPYHAADWQTLMMMLPDTASLRSEKFWALSRAIQFNKWQIRRRPKLAHPCVKFLPEITVELKSLCLQLIAELPGKHSPRHLAKVIGVEPDQLDAALRAAGVAE
ncbi:MAG: hypothetical protein HKN85_06415 [Gammaproteobacteria bacterium]|nr:hypothetical protein [Gammaproteobacteria bacterium]